jgi:hypothetical protein
MERIFFGRVSNSRRAFIWTLLLFTPNAFAYIPPSQYILKTWLGKHSGVKSVRIKTVVTALEKDKPTDVHFRETTYYQFDRQTLKSFASDDAERRLYSIEQAAVRMSPTGKILLGTDLRDVSKTLRDKKVPIRSEEELQGYRTEGEKQKSETESIGRLNSTFAWVIGTPPTKKGDSPEEGQIWFEKDTFLPLRFVLSNTRDRDTYDIRFDNYRTYREFPFPRTVTVLKKNDGAVLVSQVVDVTLNPEVPSGRSFHGGGPEGSFTDAGNSAPSAVKGLIRMYYDLVR